MACLLVTGGAGFIGSHTCLVLLEAGHRLLVLDDFSNSSPIALERVAELARVSLHSKQLKVVCGDIRNTQVIEQLFSEAKATDKPIEAVIHFAGLKAVGESVADPLRYWDVNVCGTHTLLRAMSTRLPDPWFSAAPARCMASPKASHLQKPPPQLLCILTPRPNSPLNRF